VHVLTDVCLGHTVTQAKPSFFLKLLEVMLDDSIALVLSPQAFSNVDAATDVFNNTNQQFWECECKCAMWCAQPVPPAGISEVLS
jgi:hypothetical protein